ncbi:pyocin activator PrtN family protein [Curvibacter lanceolatus]|uniref:pyocin activator PrtN family protein n=1 Tax=Curvibacter lanceolatus TaxID=86182 RepID=UPI00037C4935|nr:pyocin activator PrtN family protein [Curvibacter lanceolatus]
MNTAFLLMAQYNAQAVIPVAAVVKDYFPHLTTENFLRKVSSGDITIPLVRIEPGSQKAARGVHLSDLAKYLDDRRAAAVKEARQLAGQPVHWSQKQAT